MSLASIFTKRVERATNILSASKSGPKHIKFKSEDLSTIDSLKTLHSQFPAKATATYYLYQVVIEGNDSELLAMARKAFRRIRSSKTQNMSRDNFAHPTSRSIYVGTSKDMHSRFRSHLGIGKGKKTWGLYMSAWALGINASFMVEYYELRDSLDEDVELIEGVLWDSLLPICGKKGGK